MGISYVEYLANPKYRKYPFKGLIGWILANRLPSVEDLQSTYEFRYYSTMVKAVTDVNNGTTANSDAEKGTAVAGVYTDENGGKNVVLLKDHTEATRIQPSVDMTINLGGHALRSSDTVCIDNVSGNVTVDGRLKGSCIEVTRTDDKTARPLQIRAGNFTIIGGRYIANAKTYISSCIKGAGTINVYDAEVIMNTTDADAYCVDISNGAVFTATNCKFTATSKNKKVYTVLVPIGCSATMTNCDVLAYSNYTYEAADYYGAMSNGISNHGILTLNNCRVMGTHSAISSDGTITVNGGTYEGYGHGGFYFSGTGTTAHVRDAIIRDCDMPDGYTATAQRNGSGFYIGGGAGMDNIRVYMDNCRISSLAESQTIVLRGSSGEKNNSLYISHSAIHTLDGRMGRVRIDNDTHRLYIGAGNNFTAENTSLPEAVVVTDEVYREVA